MKKFNLLFMGLIMLLITPTILAQNGLDFDGVDDYVETSYAGISGNNARTIEAWIKAPTITGQAVITDWGTIGTGTRFTFALINGFLRVEVQGSGKSGTTLIGDNNWHHVAVSYDNLLSTNKYSMYIDGNLEMSFDLATSVNTGSTVNLLIGSRVDGAKKFKGTIDEVRVWDHRRTLTQLNADTIGELCGTKTGLVAYHKLNHGNASSTNTNDTISSDNSGSSNDGILKGFALSGSTSNWVIGKAMGDGSVFSTQTFDECFGFSVTVGNNTYSTTGIYTDTLLGASAAGCDSIVTTDLTVQNQIDNTVVVSGSTITSNAVNVTYQWIDCDNGNNHITGETGISYTATTNGNYAVIVTDVN